MRTSGFLDGSTVALRLRGQGFLAADLTVCHGGCSRPLSGAGRLRTDSRFGRIDVHNDDLNVFGAVAKVVGNIQPG